MNLAIVHYQLNRGGVTQVILNHLLALDRQLTGEQWRVAILFGGRHDAWLGHLDKLEHLDVKLHVVPQLDFDDFHQTTIDAETLADAVQAELDERSFHPRETVIHAHNHSLGKNVALPGALLALAQRGYGLLLQIHDFAEDYRAGNFRSLIDGARAARAVAHFQEKPPGDSGPPPLHGDTSFCYPQAPHIHYATINSRDDGVLDSAGVADTQRHLIANPVTNHHQQLDRGKARKALDALFDVARDQQYVLYPVRCIRRKNVGEAVLWSLVSDKDTVFGFTLPPENPRLAPAYRDWKCLASTLDLPCRFEVGREGGLRYPENIAASDLILTTSLVEGFGMVYLETWLTGHHLAGRDLPEVTGDFVRAGLQFDHLQPSLPVSVDLVGATEFASVLRQGYGQVVRDFGVAGDGKQPKLEQRIERCLQEGVVDFGELDETLQQNVVHTLADNPAWLDRFRTSNSWMSAALNDVSEAAVSNNAACVDDSYGLDGCGKLLKALYESIGQSERTDSVCPLEHPGELLEYFLDADRYRPIAT